jgi:radical SAM protein with 4Fe4S-binding SPASM domain
MQSGEVTCCFEVHGPEHPFADDLVFGRLDERGLHVDEARWRSLASRTAEARADCQECLCRYHCQGDCIGRTFETGVAASPTPSVRCVINRRVTAFLLLKGIERMGGVWVAEAEGRGVPNERAS